MPSFKPLSSCFLFSAMALSITLSQGCGFKDDLYLPQDAQRNGPQQHAPQQALSTSEQLLISASIAAFESDPQRG